MGVVEDLVLATRDLLPLRVREIEHDTFLVLVGEEWSFAITCTWNWLRADGTILHDEDADAEDRVWDLCGLEIVGFDPPALVPHTLHVVFGDGSVLAVESDPGWDPWVFRHAALDRVYVGEIR